MVWTGPISFVDSRRADPGVGRAAGRRLFGRGGRGEETGGNLWAVRLLEGYDVQKAIVIDEPRPGPGLR
jgi:hypothetical protein